MSKSSKKNQRHNCNSTHNISESPSDAKVLRSVPSKKQERAKANSLRSQISFADLLRHEGKNLTKADQGYICPCPFCLDLGSHFYIRNNDRSAICFNCDWTGDIIDYVMDSQNACLGCALEILSEVHKDSHPKTSEKTERIALVVPPWDVTGSLTPYQANSLSQELKGKDVVLFVPAPFTADSNLGQAVDVIRSTAKSLTVHDVSNEMSA